jgi:bleomycin hydrolase
MREDSVRAWTRDVFADETTRVLADVATHAGVRAPLFDHRVLRLGKQMHTFSHTLDKMTAADQEGTGRCWGFAGLSLLRRALAKERKLCPDFELSQSHLMFYDKLEKAYAFLKRMQRTDLDERRRIHLRDAPIHDGGNWHTFVALVRKYGVVPASVFPETDPSSHSRHMNAMLRTLLLQTAARADLDDTVVESAMRRVHRLLCVCMGAPPTAPFTWTYTDTEKATHTVRDWTPLDCYAACGVNLDDFVVLAHLPNPPEKNLGEAYTVEFLDTVHDAPPGVFYNVGMDELVAATYEALKAGLPVWFACEFDRMRLREDGLLHHNLVQLERAIGEGLASRQTRIQARAVDVNHAMLLTGYHDEGREWVTRWQVENSHGTEHANGYLSMSSGWFHNHVFYVAVPRKYATSKLKTFPVKALPPWDVVGAVL